MIMQNGTAFAVNATAFAVPLFLGYLQHRAVELADRDVAPDDGVQVAVLRAPGDGIVHIQHGSSPALTIPDETIANNS